MSLKSGRKIDLLNAIEDFIINSDLTFKVKDETGDYLFYLTSKSGNQFTFVVCDGYVEFYEDRSHDLINFYQIDYIEMIIGLIGSYLES